jgi:hypothetical protein
MKKSLLLFTLLSLIFSYSAKAQDVGHWRKPPSREQMAQSTLYLVVRNYVWVINSATGQEVYANIYMYAGIGGRILADINKTVGKGK